MYLHYLDLPPLPKEFDDIIFDSVENSVDLHRIHFKRDYSADFFRAYNLSPIIKNWISENITELKYLIENQNISIQSLGWTEIPNIHKDIRTWTINYIIEPGGENVETVFYDDNKVEIDRFCIEKRRWHILPRIGDTFHTVVNLDKTKRRTALTLCYGDRTFLDVNEVLKNIKIIP